MSIHSRAVVEQRIRNLLVTDLAMDSGRVAACDSSTPLVGHGIGLDSIELMALALSIEREFDLQIPDEEMTIELFKDIGTLTAYIWRKTI